MTIENIEQRFVSYQLEDEQFQVPNTGEGAGDSLRHFKTKLLADELYRLLLRDSTSLLDDILSHPLSIDYFNVYLSLPIFGQRVLCHRTTQQLDFDPPLLAKHQEIYEEAKQWLIHCRLDNYIHTDIYIESLLALLLINSDERIETSSKLHIFAASEEGQTHIFSTVTDVRHFHQFLQSTSGIKYWNFFIDSMRLLRSQFHRIDISYLNFIFKYYSRQHEFHSIIIDLNKSRMPDSSTSDAIWFQMAINAMHQLRAYWLPRYLSQRSSSSRVKIKQWTVNINKSPSENTIVPLSDQPSHTNAIRNESKLVKFTLGNISYLDYNPRQYILIQPSEQHEEFNESDNDDNSNHQIETDRQMKFEYPSSDHSIEEYATDANIELFYRILVSDSLAGSPFFEYISQTISKTEATPCQTCIHFITDAEVLLSIPPGNFKERILKQFISRYLGVIATDALPNQVFDNIDEQKMELINELRTNDNNQYPLLWKILLKITKLLTPHFLNYIKFDRLRFLVQGKALNTSHIIDDLCRLLPSVNFEILLTDQHNTEETQLNQIDLKNCGERSDDLLKSLIKNRYTTTEKLINTDEQCQFRTGERFPPLTNDELERELRQFCTKIEWKDIKTILGNSFDAPITSHQPAITTFIGDPLSHNKVKETLNSPETFTLEIMNSAREIFEIDRYVSNLMNDSLHLFQTKAHSSEAIKTDRNSSPQSSIFEEILRTDSSPTLAQLPTNDINTNALISSHLERNSSEKPDIVLSRSIEPKFLSRIGSYFINPPSKPSQISQFSGFENISINNSLDPIIYNYLQDNHFKPINEFTLHHQFDSLPPLSHGLIKELTIDSTGIGHLYIDLTKTDISLNEQDVLKLKLYTNNHLEFLLADVTSYTIDSTRQELQLHLDNFKLPDIIKPSSINVKRVDEKDTSSHQSIRFAPKDKSNEIKNTVIEKRISYFQNDDQQQLLLFIQNQISNHQWPLQEYIGMKGQRAWRALKLAADISNLDSGFMGNYHNDLDWISTEDDLGSFGERTYLIIRNFERRIEQQRISINKNSC